MERDPMTLMRRLSALLAMAIALLLLFVVVCPETPTPITVVSAQGTLAASPVALVVGTAFALAMGTERVLALCSASSHLPLPSHTSVLDLTCVRLC